MTTEKLLSELSSISFEEKLEIAYDPVFTKIIPYNTKNEKIREKLWEIMENDYYLNKDRMGNSGAIRRSVKIGLTAIFKPDQFEYISRCPPFTSGSDNNSEKEEGQDSHFFLKGLAFKKISSSENFIIGRQGGFKADKTSKSSIKDLLAYSKRTSTINQVRLKIGSDPLLHSVLKIAVDSIFNSDKPDYEGTSGNIIQRIIDIRPNQQVINDLHYYLEIFK